MEAAATGRSVVVAVPDWMNDDVCKFSAELVRTLNTRGWNARLMLSERPVASAGPVPPEDVPFDVLPLGAGDGWAERWIALIRWLEERAPCTYISNQDRAAACVASRLSARVNVIAMLHEDSAEDYYHCGSIGQFCDALIALDPVLRQRIFAGYPDIAPRVPLITRSESHRTTPPTEDLAELFTQLPVNVSTGRFRRRRRKLVIPPPGSTGATAGLQLHAAIKKVNAQPLWPDPSAMTLRDASSDGAAQHRIAPAAARPSAVRDMAPALRDHTIVLTVTSGRISGVDIFTINLARELSRRGFRTEIVQTLPGEKVTDPLPLPGDVRVSLPEFPVHPTWRDRWRTMRTFLSARAPAIYVPNYDIQHSAMIPTLPDSVRVIGIAHSDDPSHYEHVVRLEPYWDAVVCVSTAVREHLESLAPGLVQRLRTIPYGVDAAGMQPRDRSPGTPLRIVYAGRIAREQKRVFDLFSVAQELAQRNVAAELTVIGLGPDITEFLHTYPQFAVSRRMRYVGSISNDRVVEEFRNQDAFILPSSFEGLPVSLLEAMAQGCVPVVSAIRSGIPELIRDGANGFVVPIGDAASFAERLTQLSASPELLKRMSVAAYRTIQGNGYRTEDMTDRYVELFDEVAVRRYARPEGKVVPPDFLRGLPAMTPRLPLPVRRAVWRVRGIVGSAG